MLTLILRSISILAVHHRRMDTPESMLVILLLVKPHVSQKYQSGFGNCNENGSRLIDLIRSGSVNAPKELIISVRC